MDFLNWRLFLLDKREQVAFAEMDDWKTNSNLIDSAARLP